MSKLGDASAWGNVRKRYESCLFNVGSTLVLGLPVCHSLPRFASFCHFQGRSCLYNCDHDKELSLFIYFLIFARYEPPTLPILIGRRYEDIPR
jgi:hypothetical protein